MIRTKHIPHRWVHALLTVPVDPRVAEHVFQEAGAVCELEHMTALIAEDGAHVEGEVVLIW